MVSPDGVAPSRMVSCLPLLILPYTIKSRSSLLALAHPGGPGKRAVKWLWCGVVVLKTYIMLMIRYVTLCPHSWYLRVVQSTTCPFRELSSPLVNQSTSWCIRELSSNLLTNPSVLCYTMTVINSSFQCCCFEFHCE